MAWFGDALTVYPLTQEWRFSVSRDGTSGTRVYLEATGQIPGATTETLPKIGDAWDTNYTTCVVVSIDVSYLNDNPNCGRRFVANYQGIPYTETVIPFTADDLPKSVEIGSEQMAIEEPGSDESHYWKWESDNVAVKQPIFKHWGIANIRFTKTIKDMKKYIYTCMTYVNHINSGTFFGFPAEMVMFEGANLYQYKNRMGADRWKAELVFAVRNVTDDFISGKNGWNYVLRKNGTWDKPKDLDGNFLYTTMDFDTLISEHDLNNDEDYYNTFPVN